MRQQKTPPESRIEQQVDYRMNSAIRSPGAGERDPPKVPRAQEMAVTQYYLGRLLTVCGESPKNLEATRVPWETQGFLMLARLL